MITDKFWKLFWIVTGGATLLGLAFAVSLFLYNTRQGDLLSAVGVSYQEGKDPFEGTTLGGAVGGLITLSSGYLYQNSLPLHFKSWTWEALADWRSSEQVYEGASALKATFSANGGTVGMNGPAVDLKGMNSISLLVRVDPAVGDLYLNLYDKNGNALAQQSVGWYAASSTLSFGTWEHVIIPLRNFGVVPTAISGFSISGKNPGVAYVDAVQLLKTDSDHAVWVAPPEVAGQAYNPFATSTPFSLPYTLDASPEAVSHWYSYFGVFAQNKIGDVIVGPSAANKSTGSLSVFRNGRAWSDYHIDAVLNWGEVSVFSLIGRVTSDGDFVSCAFSRYGETAQLYQVTKGTSNFISQTPPLAVKDYEPWVGVHVGMEVVGKSATCFIDGNQVLHADLPTLSPQGSAGIETWDPNPAAAPHTLRSFTVTQISSE
jgi:hypothetical protein